MLIQTIINILVFIFGLWLGWIQGHEAGVEITKEEFFNKYELDKREEE